MIKRKLILNLSLSSLIIPSFLFISCSTSNINNDNLNEFDKIEVENYIKTLKPEIKSNKLNSLPETYASSINDERSVQEWFEELPQSNGTIQVEFVSSLDKGLGILEVKYLILKNSYTQLYKFEKSGFKIGNEDISQNQKDVIAYVNTLNPHIRTNKQNLLSITYASSINTEIIVQEWFEELPQSNGTIQVEFVSSLDKGAGNLEIKYLISQNDYTYLYTFIQSGFNQGPISSTDRQTVLDYIKTLNPTLKSNINKNNEYVENIVTEVDVERLFDNLPQSHNNIDIEFVGVFNRGDGLLEVKYLISCNDYSSIYSFQESGFKVNPLNVVETFVRNLNPQLKTDKNSLKSSTYASYINIEERVKEWFEDLPQNDRNKGITVLFISAKPSENDNSTLIITYRIKKDNYTQDYSFQEKGFKYLDPVSPDSSLMDFKQFSEKNSFRIRFGVYNRKFFTDGTAWSWYYVKHTEYMYDWYLMTNFHVIDNVVADVNGYLNANGAVTNANALGNYYASNFTTNYDVSLSTKYFDLMVYDDEKGFQSIVGAQKRDNTNNAPNMVSQKYIKSLDIITDFQNDNITLFSENQPLPYNYYNLDMALVKISFDFQNDRRFLNDSYKKENVYEKYLNSSNKDDLKVKSNTGISVAGFPIEANNASKNKLVVYNSNYAVNMNASYQNLDFNSSVLPRLKGPYYYLNNSEFDFLLSGGASGSAVYQLDNPSNYISWNDIVPVGIYWGGISDVFDSSRFNPSFLPFIYSNGVVSYNVFENFKNSLNKLK